MSEAPEGPYAGMPDVVLHYECTMNKLGGSGECGGDAKYIARGHSCQNAKTSRQGKLWAVCQAHIDDWQEQEYPMRCGGQGCGYAFNGPLDIIWEVHEL